MSTPPRKLSDTTGVNFRSSRRFSSRSSENDIFRKFSTFNLFKQNSRIGSRHFSIDENTELDTSPRCRTHKSNSVGCTMMENITESALRTKMNMMMFPQKKLLKTRSTQNFGFVASKKQPRPQQFGRVYLRHGKSFRRTRSENMMLAPPFKNRILVSVL